MVARRSLDNGSKALVIFGRENPSSSPTPHCPMAEHEPKEGQGDLAESKTQSGSDITVEDTKEGLASLRKTIEALDNLEARWKVCILWSPGSLRSASHIVAL